MPVPDLIATSGVALPSGEPAAQLSGPPETPSQSLHMPYRDPIAEVACPLSPHVLSLTASPAPLPLAKKYHHHHKLLKSRPLMQLQSHWWKLQLKTLNRSHITESIQDWSQWTVPNWHSRIPLQAKVWKLLHKIWGGSFSTRCQDFNIGTQETWKRKETWPPPEDHNNSPVTDLKENEIQNAKKMNLK